mmetsp:Transcript_44331/g.77196  ORF Transcript_44331/g.77196 Transcript_44331/m.77196 type:complete len:327 (-) Transcript_44331:750-1730(-)
MDVAHGIMHLVKHHLASSSFLFRVSEHDKVGWCEAKTTRGFGRSINQQIESLGINSTISICICFGETVQQEAVQLLVFHAVTVLTSCYNKCCKIGLAPLHLALSLVKAQSGSLLADVRVNEIQPMVKIDEATPVRIDTGKELHAGLDLLLRSLELLSYCWCKAKTPWQGSCNINHGIKLGGPNPAIEVAICFGEALQYELVELMEFHGIPALGGPLDECDKVHPAVLCHCQGDCLLKIFQGCSLLTNVLIAELQPSLEMDIPCPIVHLVEHGFASGKLLGFCAICGRCWRCKAKAPRRVGSHFNQSIKALRINATIAISVSLRKAM